MQTTTIRNAFAKLSGQIGGTGPPNFEYLIHDLPSVLGRASIDPQDTLMSRQHVELKWCAGKGWQLICLSKNGCTVDKVKYNKDEVANLHHGMNLSSSLLRNHLNLPSPPKPGSAMRFGNARLYFTLPKTDGNRANKKSKNNSEEMPQPSQKSREHLKFRIVPVKSILSTAHPADMMNTGNKKRPLSATDFDAHDGEDEEDDDGDGNLMIMTTATGPSSSSSSSSTAPSKGGQPSLYLPMIQSAFASGEMTLDADQAVNQHDLIEWVVKNCAFGQVQLQTVRKGVKNCLSKYYCKVGDEEELAIKQKKGTTRWRKKIP